MEVHQTNQYVFYNRKNSTKFACPIQVYWICNSFFSDLQWTNHFESEFTKLFVGKVRHVTQLMSNDGSGKTDFSNTIQGLKQANPGEKQNLFLWKCNLSCLGGHYFVRVVLNSNTEEAYWVTIHLNRQSSNGAGCPTDFHPSSYLELLNPILLTKTRQQLLTISVLAFVGTLLLYSTQRLAMFCWWTF